MKVQNLAWIVVITGVSVILSRCTIDEGPQYLGEFKLDDVGRSYIEFNLGSSWTYKNDSTLKEDTYTLESFTSDLVYFSGDKYSFRKEIIGWNWSTSHGGNIRVSRRNPIFADANRDRPLNINTDIFAYTQNSRVGDVNFFFYPFNQSFVGGSSDHRTYVTKMIDSMSFNGFTFEKVVVFETNYDPRYDQPSNYYWAKDVGLVKIELYSYDRETVEETISLTHYILK